MGSTVLSANRVPPRGAAWRPEKRRWINQRGTGRYTVRLRVRSFHLLSPTLKSSWARQTALNPTFRVPATCLYVPRASPRWALRSKGSKIQPVLFYETVLRPGLPERSAVQLSFYKATSAGAAPQTSPMPRRAGPGRVSWSQTPFAPQIIPRLLGLGSPSLRSYLFSNFEIAWL